MADEAFALSPISARATQPREEDYEAIRDAFMETSRGRWFLGEYAKRNRNADTRMVLDAVARIEESLAAQQQPAPENGLAEALAAIRTAVDEARAAASAALDSLALEENLAPVRKGARVIREIAWRLREIGADGRICDLIDSQVGAIEAGCGQLASVSPKPALSAAFDLIEQRIGDLGDAEEAIHHRPRSHRMKRRPPTRSKPRWRMTTRCWTWSRWKWPRQILPIPISTKRMSRNYRLPIPKSLPRCPSRHRRSRRRFNRHLKSLSGLRFNRPLARRLSPMESCEGPLHRAPIRWRRSGA